MLAIIVDKINLSRFVRERSVIFSFGKKFTSKKIPHSFLNFYPLLFRPPPTFIALSSSINTDTVTNNLEY